MCVSMISVCNAVLQKVSAVKLIIANMPRMDTNSISPLSAPLAKPFILSFLNSIKFLQRVMVHVERPIHSVSGPMHQASTARDCYADWSHWTTALPRRERAAIELRCR